MPNSRTSSSSSPAPACLVDPGQRIAENDHRRNGQDVPGVEERHAAEQERRQEEACFAEVQFTDVQVDPPAEAAEEQVQREGDRQQEEGDGQHVRVQVAEQEGEGGELVNGFAEGAVQVVILHHAGGAPPPPEAVGSPCRNLSTGHCAVRGCRAMSRSWSRPARTVRARGGLRGSLRRWRRAGGREDPGGID